MDNAVILIEAALQRPVVLRLVDGRDVPLARHERLVIGGLQDFRNRPARRAQVVGVSGQRAFFIHHVPDAGLVRVQSAEQARARRAAARTVVELSESHPLAREPVEIGRRDLGTIGPDIGIAHIIRQYENDVRRPRGRGLIRLALMRPQRQRRCRSHPRFAKGCVV